MSRLNVVAAAGCAFMLLQRSAAGSEYDRDLCIAAAQRAQQQRDHGELRAARESLIACLRDVCPRVVREDCASWMAEVSQREPTVVPAARDGAGRDLTDVRVLVDGVVLATTLNGKAVAIDPGRHEFSFEASNGVSTSLEVVIAEGQKNRQVLATLDLGLPSSPTPSPSLEVAAVDRGPARRSAGISTGVWISSGIAVAALGAFIVAGLVGQSEYSDMRDGCARTHACSQANIDAARAKFVVADVAGIVAIIAGGATVWQLVRR